MKKYINGFLRLGTAAALLVVIYGQNKKINELKTENKNITVLKKECDSLKFEMFSKDTQLGRYEMTLDILGEKDPKVAKKFQNIMSTETE